MLRKQVFCELAFWDAFLESYKSFSSQGLRDDNSKAWFDLYDFICRSSIHLDCDPKTLQKAAEKDMLLARVWKSHTEGKTSIVFGDDGFNKLQQKLARNLLSVIFSAKDLSSSTSPYGIIDICPDREGNFGSFCFLFKDNGVALRDGQEWNWEDLASKIRLKYSNSMVIIDNYIMKNERDNLFKILDILLPQRCAVQYDLTIIYLLEKRYNLTLEDAKRLGKEKERKVQRFLNENRRDLNLMIEFFGIPQDNNTHFHDRTIITNNLWISSGAGFDLLTKDYLHFKVKKNHSTTINAIFPYFSTEHIDWIDVGYQNVLADAKAILKEQSFTSHNRLLE